MPATGEPLLLASIHDVSPRFETEVDGLVDLIGPHVGTTFAMLVVPNHWGDAPIVPGSPFATRLREWADAGVEIFLHGFFHRDASRHRGRADRLRGGFLTAGEGEFLGLSSADATRRITDGQAIVEDVTGRPIAGFIAPAWLYGRGASHALRVQQIAIAEDHLRIWSPASGATLASGPVVTWATRTPLRLASSLLAATVIRHAPIRVLRVGVHPPDYRNQAVMRSIRTTLAIARQRRRAARYSELVRI